ncbi:MAG: hypothetical protein WA776_15745 [Xanthobacteraceae bacterium]
MADYHPTLARAVAGLPHNDAQARQDLYARARAIVAEQLRGRGVESGASEAVREQAALETAIRKIEAAAQPAQTRKRAEPRRPIPRSAGAPAQQRADNTARSLSKILQAVQPDETSEAAAPRPRRKSMNVSEVAPVIEPPPSEASETTPHNPLAELGGAPNSLGTMLFVTAYIVAALAFTGVTYIRSIVWLYQGVIGYPILLAIMAVTLALFIVPPLMIFRKASALPAIDIVLRYIRSASRRAL